jgi:hypothetical protein
MSMRRKVVSLGTALPLLFSLAVGQRPVIAQTSSDGLTGLVNQVSDLLITRINSGTCADFANFIGQVKDSGSKPLDSSSMIGGMVRQVSASEKLKAIVVSKVGPVMINRLFACNMIPIEALTGPPGTPAPGTSAPSTPATPAPAPTLSPSPAPSPASTPKPNTPNSRTRK